MISRGPSLTEQVRQHIKQAITDEEYEDGRIPAEAELANELGVSRTTVRDALSRLEHEGTIFRRQGAGTFVNEHGLQIKSKLDEVWSYEEVLEAHGYTPSVRIIGVAEDTASATTADALAIDEGDPVLVTEKLFLEDGVPVVLTLNRIPLSLLDGNTDEAAARLPLYDFLETHGNRNLSYYLSDIVPVVLDESAAGKLELEVGTPTIVFDEIGFDLDNQPVVRATSWFRDELLRFRLIRRRAAT